MSRANGGDAAKLIAGLMRALDASIKAAVEQDRGYAQACASGDIERLLEIVGFYTLRADQYEQGRYHRYLTGMKPICMRT